MSAQSLVDTMKKLIARETRDALPRWRWGEVISTSPLTVKLDAQQGTIAGIGTTVAGLIVGDRVNVRTWKTRSLITGVAGGGATGWVPVDYLPGFRAGTAGQLEWCRRGDVIHWRGGAHGDVRFPAGVYEVVANIPDDAIPATTTVRDGAFGQGGNAAGVEFNVNGSLILAAALSPGGTQPAWIGVATSYVRA